MDKGKQKMTAEEYEQDRRSKKMARNPPSQERLRLQPAAPLPSAMGKGKWKMTIDEYEEDRLSKNAKKPPPEGLLYLQPLTPMPLTPAPLPQSPLAGSLIGTQMDFAPMEVPMDAPMDASMDAPMEAPMDVPMEAPMEVPMDAPMEAPIDEILVDPIDVPINPPIFGTWSDCFTWLPVRMGRPYFINGEWIFVEQINDGAGYMDEGTFNRVKASLDDIDIDPLGRKTIYEKDL